MASRKLIVGFFWRFTLLYGLLILPWPGLNEIYGSYFRALGQRVFAHESGPRLLRFEAVPADIGHHLDTRIALANCNQLDRQGSGPVRYLELDTRGIGWVPTALLLALIMATPIPWRRKTWAMWWGLLLMHGFILFSVAAYIWNGSTALSLLSLTAFWKQIAEGLEETLITQMGASFVAPVFIWILVAIRSRDLVAWRSGGPGSLRFSSKRVG